jgi:two-component system, NtrC family, sensor histidine kinase HydH
VSARSADESAIERPPLVLSAEPSPGLAGRLAWMTGLRLVFFTILLALTAVFYLGGELSRYPVTLRIVFATIAVAYALGGAYAVILRTGRHLEKLAYAQIILDQITWSAIVYVTGGATSGATSFYAFSCLIGASLIGLRGSFTAAAAGSASFAVLCGLFASGWLSPPPDQSGAYLTHGSDLIYPLLVNGLGILVVAILAAYLSERLRITGGALERANARVLEAERLAVLGRIAAGLAHEIRNPLGSIRGSIEMLGESPLLSPEDKELCAIVRREAIRLSDLVTDMLDLSGPKPPKMSNIDIVALAGEVVALSANSERSATGDVTVVYEGPTEPHLARGDGAQMRQVMWNLVRNAVQVSPAGATVKVTVTPKEGEVVIAVDDDGPGIAAEARARIFDAFYTTRAHGVGIGLALVKRIIDEHKDVGARVEVLSPPGRGASFRVTLRDAAR